MTTANLKEKIITDEEMALLDAGVQDEIKNQGKEYSLTRKQAARRLKITTRTLDRYLKKNLLEYIKVGKSTQRILISEESVNAFKEDQKAEAKKDNNDLSAKVFSDDELEKKEARKEAEAKAKELEQKVENEKMEGEVVQIYKNLYEDTKNELTEARRRLEGANYRVGELEAKLKTSIPLLEYRKTELQLSEAKSHAQKLEGELGISATAQAKLAHNLKERERKLKTERNKRIFYASLLGAMVLLWSFTYALSVIN